MARLLYTSLKGLYKVTNQVSVQEILNGRINHTVKGWIDIRLTPDLRTNIIEMTVDVLGGHSKFKHILNWALSNEKPQHWGLNRMHLTEYKGKYGISYCAGQDYPAELTQIRNFLRK